MWDCLGGAREWSCIYEISDQQLCYCTSHAASYWHHWSLHSLIPSLPQNADHGATLTLWSRKHRFELAQTSEIQRGSKGQNIECKMKWVPMQHLWFTCPSKQECAAAGEYFIGMLQRLPTNPRIRLLPGSIWERMCKHVANCQTTTVSAWVLFLVITWCVTDALLHAPALFTVAELHSHEVYKYLHGLVEQLHITSTRNNWPMHHTICHPGAWENEEVHGLSTKYGESAHNWVKSYCNKHPHWYHAPVLMNAFRDMLLYPRLAPGRRN
eukprot:TRINITY_DN66188_c0_g1_i8.p1 TRINITY_DN66188_c0_g1~~TRINITY_DN66188_c0_g1_i8.p1  ORF type:complete len:277 (-),score=18.95 TRINITY_DN66188_c0_g1_i8:3-806(-)